jgi:hypothetical protein
MRLATREIRVVLCHGRDRMRFSFPRVAADGPGSRIIPKRGADVRTSFTRGCAARCCSGRSLKCQPARPPNQTTTSVRVNRRRSRPAAPANTLAHSPGRMAGDSGFSMVVKPTGFSPNCCSIPNPVGTSKFGAPATGGHARQPVLSLAERSSGGDDEPKRQREDSRCGS